MNSFILFIFIALCYSQSYFDTESDKWGWCDTTNYGDAVYRKMTWGEYHSREKTTDEKCPDGNKCSETHENTDYWACSFQDAYNDRFRGYTITQDVETDVNGEKKKWDLFQMFEDCCSPHSDEKNVLENTFTVFDKKPGIDKNLTFVFRGEEWRRSHSFFAVDQRTPDSTWFIDTDNIIQKSTILLNGSHYDGRTVESAKNYPVHVVASTYCFNLTSPNGIYDNKACNDKGICSNKGNEHVVLGFKWGFSPYVEVTGYLDVELDEGTGDTAYKGDTCQYRYTKAGEEGNIIEETNDEAYIAKSICKMGDFERVAICNKEFIENYKSEHNGEDYQDCTCGYSDFEYKNKAIDCTYLSDKLIFKPDPQQNIIPSETSWAGLEFDEDTEINIPKSTYLAFVGDNMVIPNYQLLISGRIYINGTLNFVSTEKLYDIGTFTLVEKAEINIPTNLNDKDPVIFIGTYLKDMKYEQSKGFTDVNSVFSSFNLQVQNCGGVKTRFLKAGSTLGCKCQQNDDDSFIQTDCDYLSKQKPYNFDLEFNKNYEFTDSRRYWNNLEFKGENEAEIEANFGIQTTVRDTCDFSNIGKLTMKGKLNCNKLIVSADTRIVGEEGSELKTFHVEIKKRDGFDWDDEDNGLPQQLHTDVMFRFGKGSFISDGTMEFTIEPYIYKCFDFATSGTGFPDSMNSISFEGVDEGYASYVLDKVLRVCGLQSDLESDRDQSKMQVECHATESTFTVFGETMDQCPCSGKYCYYYLEEMGANDILLTEEKPNIDANLVIFNDINIYTSAAESNILSIENGKREDGKENGVARLKGNFAFSMKEQVNTLIDLDCNSPLEKCHFKISGNNILSKITTKSSGISITFDGVSVYSVIDSTDASLSCNNGIIVALSGMIKQSDIENMYVFTQDYDFISNCLIGEFTEGSMKCLANTMGGIFNSEIKTVLNCDEYNANGYCTSCKEGFYLKVDGDNGDKIECSKCGSNCRICSNSETCIACDDDYKLNDNKNCDLVEEDGNCDEYVNGRCVKCEDYHYLGNNGACTQIPSGNANCKQSISGNDCLICKNSFILTESEGCKEDEKMIVVGNTFVGCKEGYRLDGGSCTDCGETCLECNSDGCLRCEDGYVLSGGGCVSDSDEGNHCSIISNSSTCGICSDGYYNRAECTECGNGCEICGEDGNCLICIDEDAQIDGKDCISPGSNANSVKEDIYNLKEATVEEYELTQNQCEEYLYGVCIRCKSGYFAKKGICEKCSNTCGDCIDSADFCTSCKGTNVLQDHKCVGGDTFTGTCERSMPGNVGCAICVSGFYRGNDLMCTFCPSPMESCVDATQALSCENEYFLDNGQCKSYNELSNCEEKTHDGCVKCEMGYYEHNKYCEKCVSRCSECSNSESCNLCENNYAIKGKECVHFRQLDSCVAADGKQCTKCEEGYDLKNGECGKRSLWYVYLIVAIVVIVIIVIAVVVVAYIIMKRQIKVKQDDIQKIKNLQVDLKPVEDHDYLVTDHTSFEFFQDNELKVNETTKFDQIIGNVGKTKIKIQPTLMENEKYEFTVEPELVLLSSGKCATFHFSITPLCTTKITEKVIYNILIFKIDKEETLEVEIQADTNVTNILDFDELEIDKKVGEGSFGIVYKGKFRGNKVAIKTLKGDSVGEEQMDEFNKEVSMLDKFRCDYIVHFFGAVFIPTKISMVTEFAKYGSLHHLINKEHGKRTPKEAVRIKICMDAVRGMMYLHQNGILHRDIKPDNLLIFSLEKDIPVFAKLTDFGSSRNINMMMTNMTFTKGIGTPAYMAPEVLDQSRYKTAADVFSMAVTMFETMKWGTAYPKEQFKYPWEIASYVSAGKRAEKPKKMRQEIFNIIQNSWAHDPSERLRIEEIVEQLGKFNVSYQ